MQRQVPADREDTDERKGRSLFVFHGLYGRRVNDALSRVFAIELGNAMNVEVGITVNDNGFVLMTDAYEEIHVQDIEELVSSVSKTDVSRIIKSSIRRTEMMKRRFRHAAVRSLMVLRNYKGKKISVKRQQINSEALLKAAEEVSPDFPIIKETYREILEDVMDLQRAKDVLAGIRRGEIRYEVIETRVPSPFSHVMVTFGEADVVMMKDRRRHLRELHKRVMEQIGRKGGK